MRSEEETNRALTQYADTVRRICMLYLKNQTDTEDIFQTVFMKYLLSTKQFKNREHEKAWIIRVTVNACRDWIRSFFHSRTVPLDQVGDIVAEMQEDHAEVLEAVLALPQKYKEVVYLYFYEQYTAVEIGKILGKNVNTVYTLLARAKGMPREKLGVKNLRNRIEEAFNAVHAEPELVEKTRLKLRNELYGRQKRMLRIRKYAVSFAVCLLVAVAAAGFWAYQTPVAAIFVDGNTPVELEVNCFNRIIRAEGADGDYSNLCHMQYEDAVES